MTLSLVIVSKNCIMFIFFKKKEKETKKNSKLRAVHTANKS